MIRPNNQLFHIPDNLWIMYNSGSVQTIMYGMVGQEYTHTHIHTHTHTHRKALEENICNRAEASNYPEHDHFQIQEA
ncbi:hypothetical protein PHLGIDRAFT_415211 [Phlebiopsis gigantea 11061_1 CR5-6]|uniref:Uncharacterized protein n=1 Tax=Phlebiopsis gigantea (strain 11061_1 CR5-6) TaxID=745531 RepID=A0A0C3NQM3_PHLG1|nr:hypothetical protein PHLGIDRAFT_415211 [Phlebiopsis gigantea 11061_1 CR5-6]